MKAMTTALLDKTLDDLIIEVSDDAEPTMLSARNGQQAVLVPLDEFNSWRETAYLLSTPANADHLRRSLAQAGAGETSEHELVDP